MDLKKWTVLICCWMSFTIQAQQNFQKIYLFEDTFAIFNDLYVTDSCYYYTCTSGKAYQREFFNFGRINLDGSEQVLLLNQDVSSLQRVMYSQVDMDTNFRGNFVTNFTNSSALGSVPRIKEFDVEGNLINDFIFNDLWQNDSLYFWPSNRQIIDNSDSSYYILTVASDYTTDDNSGFTNGIQGCVLFKVKYDGTILFMKKFNYLPIGTYKPTWVGLNFLQYTPTSFLMVIDEQKINSPSNYEMNWTRIHFIEIDYNGIELNHQIYQDGQYCPGSFGCTVLEDGGVLISYYESILDGSPPNNDYFRPRPVIARLNNNFDLIWKHQLNNFYGSDFGYYSNMHDFKLVNDSLFVGAYNHVDQLIFNQAYLTTMRLSQYNLDGENKWNRDYTYFSTDNFNDPEYGIYDLELTSDGGYIMCGEIYHFDSLNAGSPGQFGYVLKTNCLGFIGDPISEFTYQSNSGLLEFVNEGIQAGSYTWIFGDGDTLVTKEYVDSVSHVYDANGIYTVQLIAHGCNGEDDTISKTINVSGISNGYVGDGTLLTLYPNPLSSGESLAFYVGDIPTKDITVEVVNEIGQSVFTGKIESSQTTYIIPFNFASGVYFVSLKNNSNERLEVEKLIVL
jgi:hypothetical protein